MRVDIYSRKAVEQMMQDGFPENVAVISFYTPKTKRKDEESRVDYSNVCDRVFYIGIPDIDLKVLSDFGYTFDEYLSEAESLAGFIYQSRADGLAIICQCDYGQSRSAACAAAILQHFEGCGIDVFADYRYYPNQLVYNKIFHALEKHKKENEK